MDPGIATLAPHNVVVLGKQSQRELERQFDSAHIFVMPSLVEGFGLVFPEALAHGCFCIGTSNTGLPDIDCPTDVASVLPVADLEELTQSIVSAYELHRRGGIDHDRIQEFSRTLNWQDFRTKIADVAEANLRP